jgi:hypothetical protein
MVNKKTEMQAILKTAAAVQASEEVELGRKERSPGLKPHVSQLFTARRKLCPDTKQTFSAARVPEALYPRID